MEKGKGSSRQEAVVTGVLATLVALALLAGLGWLIHAIVTQPQSNPDNSSISLQNAPQSSNPASPEPSVTEERLAARARAAEKVQLAEIPGVNSKPSADAAHIISPTKVGSAAGQANPIHLPDVVKLEGLDDRKPPPSRVAPVDISGISRGSRAAGIRPANIGQGNAASGGVLPVAIAQTPGHDLLPKPVIIGPTRPDDADNLAPPEMRAKLKSIKRLCADHAGNVWVGTEDSLFRYSPNEPANRRWIQMAAKELGDSGVSALAVDRLGRLWVGTDHSGVLVYNGDAWAKYEIIAGVTSPDSRSGPIGQHVFRIAINPANGDVWLSTGGGLSRYSEKSDSWSYFTRSEGLPCDNILGIAFTPNGDIFCASDCNGLIMSTAADDYKTWRTIATGPAQEPATASGSGLPSNLLNDVLVGRDGTIYVASDAGLAYRRPGKDWQYLRGKDWADKVKGRLDGPPPGWDEQASAAATAPLLEEDYCTCLAEDAKGMILLGHQTSYEVIDPKDLSRKPGYLTKLNVSAILPVGGSALIAGYGDGLFEEGSVHPEPASVKNTAIPPLPSSAPPPTLAQLNELMARLESVNLLAPESQSPVAALHDDWLTRGDWLGRYGTYWACLAAMARLNFPDYTWGGGATVEYFARIDPRVKKESLRYWMTARSTSDPRALEIPPIYKASEVKQGLMTVENNRCDSYWDDHSEVTRASREGPNILCTVRIPEGDFRLSLYLASGLRDFRISIRGHSSGRRVVDIDGFENEKELAHCRMVDFRSGVWKRFCVRGPRDVTIVVERNHSHNTNLAAVMLDTLDERPMPYFKTKEQYAVDEEQLQLRRKELAATYKPGASTAPASADAELVERISSDLLQARVLSPGFYLDRSRTIWIAALRWFETDPRGLTATQTDSVLQMSAMHSLCLFQAGEDSQRINGIRTAREIERSIRCNSPGDTRESKRYDLLRSAATSGRPTVDGQTRIAE